MSPPSMSRRFGKHLRRLVGQHPSPSAASSHGPEVAYEPDLLPPLEPDGDPFTGLWSGGSRTWIAAQDLRVLRHILEAQM